MIPSLIVGALLCAQGVAPEIQRFDFQPAGANLEPGFTQITPQMLYTAEDSMGFTKAPEGAQSAKGYTWQVFSKVWDVDLAIADVLHNQATEDAVSSRTNMVFRVDVEPGTYDVDVHLGDLRQALFQIRLRVNDQETDIDRIHTNIERGVLTPFKNNNGNYPLGRNVGSSSRRHFKVQAQEDMGNPGVFYLEFEVAPQEESLESDIWLYDIDPGNCAKPDGLFDQEGVLTLPFSMTALQALEIHPAQAMLIEEEADTLVAASGSSPKLQAFVDAFNSADMALAQSIQESMNNDSEALEKASALFWLAGSLHIMENEKAILEDAIALTQSEAEADPTNRQAQRLLRQLREAEAAERYRSYLGYQSSGTFAAHNLGKSCTLTDNFVKGHPYHDKGILLWIRNRAGLDPRQCTVSYEFAEHLAQRLSLLGWDETNPYVKLYATRQWENNGEPWQIVEWDALLGQGPQWARVLTAALNMTQDLGEWWVVNRQDPVNKDLGGGFTDDVEFFPEIGLTDYTREGTSAMSRQGTNQFVDALWNSSIMDQDAGYQPQYADVEHTAEPSGMSFQLNTMLRYGNPEGIERMLKTAKTARDVFVQTQSDETTHFKGNHMSSTQMANQKKHRNDIPLNGRALSPVAWLRWYNQNPAADTLINDWLEGWITHSRSTDKDKPAGIFPASIWTENIAAEQIPGNNDVYEFEFGTPGVDDWWSAKFSQYGFQGFPSYQYYLYDLAAQSVIDAQSPTSLALFSEPFEAMVSHGLTYVDLGSPELDKDSTPNNFSGGPEAWAGKKIATKFNVATLSHVADYLGTPSVDVQRYMDAFASDYTRYRLDPSDPTPILESYEYYKDAIIEKWPFSTSEGVMTDRVAVSPGIFSYVLGVDVFALYFGMPKPAVTWKDSGQLFSAAVSKATSEVVEASLYRFADNTKNMGARFWSLEEGGVYRITTGPASHEDGDETGGLGAAPDPARQNEWHVQTFVYAHRNQVIEFPLPGREVYALRLEQIASAINPQPLADLAIGPEDVVFNASSSMIDVTVHNIGRVASMPVSVKVVELRNGEQFVLGEQELPVISAPLDLVDQNYTLRFPATGLNTLSRVRINIDREDEMNELCETNNVLLSGLDGQEQSIPYPYASHTSTAKVRAGRTFDVYGTNLSAITAVELNEGENDYFEILSAEPQSVKVRVSNLAPKGQHFLSLVSSAGEKTNLFSMKILSAKKLSAKRASHRKSIDMGYFRGLAGCAATPLSLWICLPLLGLLRRRKKNNRTK